MEKRKVQLTGGTTFTVSLPKEWAEDSGIEAGSEVEFHQTGRALLLQRHTDDDVVEGTLDIHGLEDEQLLRAIVTMYVNGFETIILEAEQVTPAQRRTIRSATQHLIGFEVVEETGDHVEMRDVLDAEELSLANALRRMRRIATTMVDDAVTALIEDDDELATNVRDRDDDVDRLWYLVSRTFRTTLHDPTATTESGLSQAEYFDYHSSARQLERIADHAAKIAQLAQSIGAIPEQTATAIEELHTDATEIIERALDALVAEESESAMEVANAAREDVLRLDEHAREIDAQIQDEQVDPQQAQILGLVVDSLSRSGSYGGNIAETALQQAAPSPTRQE